MMLFGGILITGAAGFIGSALGRRLSAAGERIVGLDLVPADDASFPCVVNDVRDVEAIHDLCNAFDVDRIVHAGGISGRSVERRDKNAPIAVNVTGTATIFEAARRHGVSRVVLCSSGSRSGRFDGRDAVSAQWLKLPWMDRSQPSHIEKMCGANTFISTTSWRRCSPRYTPDQLHNGATTYLVAHR